MNYIKKEFSNLATSFISDKTKEIHASLYEGYVNNTNKLLQNFKTLDKASPEYAETKRRLGWEWNGMRLHELYFENLGGNGLIDKEGKVFKNITEAFGSFEAWQEDFMATAKMRGIGWAILYRDESGSLINFWIDEHATGHPSGARPILILDVFEHAYFLDFGKDRASYVESFMKNIDWSVIEKRLA
ncbi:MAG: superoxide dismutase [Patescibacteria group bacterium]